MSGYFTATESAAVAAFYALVVGLGYGEFRVRDLPRIVLDTVETTGVMMALVMSAALLAYALSLSVCRKLRRLATQTVTSPIMYLLLVNVIPLVVGCFMEAIAAMLILIPILVPPAIALGIDPIQFGVVVVLNLMIGTITPPVGSCCSSPPAWPTCRSQRWCGRRCPSCGAARGAGGDHLAPSLTTWLPGVMR